jgi:small-conductance mechanosensitive channel
MKGEKMRLVQFLTNQRLFKVLIIFGAITLIPIFGAFTESETKPEPMPLTTNDPNMSKEELAYRVEPLARDDLLVEADGWQQVLKEHVGQVSAVQIQALTAPVVKVHELADSSVNFVVRPWVATDNYWDVYWDITRAVKEQFDAEGVSIPFPQRDVHVHQVEATA